MVKQVWTLLIVLFALTLVACDATQGTTSARPLNHTYKVIHEYPHDPGAFTQGLIYHGGVLYEGTGYWEQSSLRKVALETGEVLQQRMLNEPGQRMFGEGITLWGDKLIQLTWRAKQGFVYDLNSFERTARFTYPTEGWGLTHDNTRLIMSDGTATLYFLNPDTFEQIGHIQVKDGDTPVKNLNELEYVEGEVYANVWLTDTIVRIDPDNGHVLGRINLAGLLSERSGSEDVLNGIAYDPQNQRLFVTGKFWPKLFEIELVPAP